jgi:hypothetical protein
MEMHMTPNTEVSATARRAANFRKSRAEAGECQVLFFIDRELRAELDAVGQKLGAKNRSEIITKAIRNFLETQHM